MMAKNTGRGLRSGTHSDRARARQQPRWSALDVAAARQLREARAEPVVFPEPWLPCPRCGLDGWHLIEHRAGMAGVYATWPDPVAGQGAHWLRTCVWCWHEWREPA